MFAEAIDYHPRESSQPPSVMELVERQQLRLHFQNLLERIYNVMDGDVEDRISVQPERWFGKMARALTHLERSLASEHPMIHEYVRRQLPHVFAALRRQAGYRERVSHAMDPRNERGRIVSETVHSLVPVFQTYPVKPRTYRITHVPLREVLRDREYFAGDEKICSDGAVRRVLKVRLDRRSPWHEFILPSGRNMFHKGGAPRAVLKTMAKAPRESIAAELPPHDFDVLAFGDMVEIEREATALGVDPEGIEHVPSFSDWNDLFASRDTNINQVVLGRDEIIFAEDAYASAKTGLIWMVAYNRQLYGAERIWYEDGNALIELFKGRATFRLVKFVVESKAARFRLPYLNRQIPVGVYWLILARRFARKGEICGEFMNRMLYLAHQLGEAEPWETDVYAFLDRIHEQYPFFRAEVPPFDAVGVGWWHTGKLLRLMERQFREWNNLGTDLMLNRFPGDTDEFEVSLDGYVSSPQGNAAVAAGWGAFVERCQARSSRHKEGARRLFPENRNRMLSTPPPRAE